MSSANRFKHRDRMEDFVARNTYTVIFLSIMFFVLLGVSILVNVVFT